MLLISTFFPSFIEGGSTETSRKLLTMNANQIKWFMPNVISQFNIFFMTSIVHVDNNHSDFLKWYTFWHVSYPNQYDQLCLYTIWAYLLDDYGSHE